MARAIPPGWTKVSKYAMTRGDQSVCRVYVDGVMWWEMWDGSFPKTAKCHLRQRDDAGGLDACIALADNMRIKEAA